MGLFFEQFIRPDWYFKKTMQDLVNKIQSVGSEALTKVNEAKSFDDLEQVRVQFLGKKGALSEVLKALGTLQPADRPKIGAVSNEWER